MAIPADSNGNTKENEKRSKYKDLEIEVNRTYRARTKIVPVVNGALGTIKKGLYQNLQLLPSHLSAIELQKITLMSTTHNTFKSAGVNRFDLLLRSVLTRVLPPNN